MINLRSLIPELRWPIHSLSTKLSLGILLLAIPIFIISLGVLYTQSQYMIRKEAVGRANSVLDATMQRISRKLAAIETATNATSWLISQYLQPDSLLSISHRIVRLNPHIDGCSISTEPYFFPEYGKYFSVYSIRETTGKLSASGNEGDTIITVIEEKYEYFVKPWYKLAHDLGKPCWVDFYDETDSLEVSLSGMIASYSKPIYDSAGHMAAIISTDLSLLHFSKVISEEKPYPNSYFMMLDKEGRYFIHPDSTRLFSQTIFNNADPSRQTGLIALGHEMTAGNQGNMAVVVDGAPCLVCYQPVPGTTWSLAIVCPDRDVLEGYHKQTLIVVPLLIIGLLVILLLCHRTVAHAIRPINQLLNKTQSIADGNMEVYIPRSQSENAVGQLQNSFATMLQSLNFHMGSVRYTTEQTQLRNEELALATKLAIEGERQKTAFIQNVSHQIRTPLNIIMGFAQILSETNTNTLEQFAEEEFKSITRAMDHNSKLLNRIVQMLFDSSDTGLSEALLVSTKRETVPCNDVAREAINYTKLHYSDLHINFQTTVADDFCIHTSRLYLIRSLCELHYNSARYSDGQHVSLRIISKCSPSQTVSFIIEDTGKGINKVDLERLFKFFTKVDDLSEGLGLGLPLTKTHARNLGGDLTLDENYRKGCRFIFEIPVNCD